MFSAPTLSTRTAVVITFALGLVLVATDVLAQVQRPDKSGSYYRVRIDSSPQGATLYLDGKEHGSVGQTPWEGRLQSGEWTLRLEKDGYESREQRVQIVRTRQLQETFVTLREEAQPATIAIGHHGDPDAEGAEVRVSGEVVGHVPVEIEVSDGRHLVEVRQEGFEDFREWVSAEDGETVTVTPVLSEVEPEGTGQILVRADVEEAEVFLDDEEVTGGLPLLLEDVTAGVRQLEVRGPDDASWAQAVEVEADTTAEVDVNLLGDGGTVRVLSNVEDAEVRLDGQAVGEVPVDIEDVRPGEHVIEVVASGYATREERIEVGPGQDQVVKLDLEAAGEALLEVVSPVPEAVVYINGERIGEVPQRRDVSAGEHFVVVSKPGYQDFEELVSVDAGGEAQVWATLEAAGEVRFISNPPEADVFIDGDPVGVTPFTLDEVRAGDRVVTVRKPGYEDFEQTVHVEGGGADVINANLQPAQRTAEEIEHEIRSLTSFGARTLPWGRSTIDIAGGYPYFLDTRITVGADDVGDFGLDAGVFLRTFFSRTEVGVTGRLRMLHEPPFSAGAFANVGGGGNFFDDSSRNTFFTDLGLVASLSALRYVTVSGRAYLNAYTDRHCPELEGGDFPDRTDPVSSCEEYRIHQAQGSSGLSQNDIDRIDELVGGDPFGRDSGVRGMISGIVEFAVEQRWNVWLVFEGAPFQGSRASYTNYFNKPMFGDDIGTYIRLGATLKF